MQAMLFLINTAFSLLLMVVILRVWLQLVRADFYNPFSQFVVKATNPAVLPLRRLIPSTGHFYQRFPGATERYSGPAVLDIDYPGVIKLV